MIQVVLKVAISDKRGTLKQNEKGSCKNKIPHSNGKIPVWWDSQKKKHKFHYPEWMLPEEIEFVNNNTPSSK